MLASLKNTFQAAIQNSTTLRFIFNHAERISSLSYVIGNLILFTKQGLDFNLETLAGTLFLGTCAALWKAKKNPFFMKIAGCFMIAAGLVLGASGYGLPGFLSQIFSALPIIVGGALMATGGKTKKHEKTPPSTLGKIYNFVRKNPVLSAALIQTPSRPLLLYSALLRGDIGLAFTAISWLAGDIALAASDPNIRKAALPAQTLS